MTVRSRLALGLFLAFFRACGGATITYSQTLPCCTLSSTGTIREPTGCAVCNGALLPPTTTTTSTVLPTTSSSSTTTTTTRPTSSSTSTTSSRPPTTVLPTTTTSTSQPTQTTQPTTTAWARAIGDVNSDSIAGVGAGAEIVAGGATKPVGAVNPAGLVVAYDSAGTRLWTRVLASSVQALVDAVAVDEAGDVLAAGRFGGTLDVGCGTLTAAGASDILLAKLRGTDGSCLWSKNFGGTIDDVGSGVATDPAGNVYLTGYFRGSASFGGAVLKVPFDTDLDVFVAKFTPAGVHVWSKNFTNNGTDRGYGIAADATGVVITGSYSNTIDFGGGPLVSPSALTDIFVAKFTPTGAPIWSKHFGSATTNEGGYSVAMDTAGNVVVTGYCWADLDFGNGSLPGNSLDAFLVKLAANDGSAIWSRRVGGAGADYGYAVAVDDSGNVTLVGSTNGSIDFGGQVRTTAGLSDGFLVRYTAGLGLRDVVMLGGGNDDWAKAGMVDASGASIAGGYFNNAGIFAGQPLTSAGLADGFVVRVP